MRRQPQWYRSYPKRPSADPYNPNSPSYAERSRAHETTTPTGMTVVSMGGPIDIVTDEKE
ncbi:hypothetical protein [Sphingosinicella microcystinivorans]|uniref:Uncharacterized protein n=1 Tax=Sphingosinicella microcystinivorans TaxID=335406 RepID=A0A495RG74_SPHMI|nr:hypothetical protein [Sphingosinicella microcystinivorans]RKS86502.1 hypothetical protein DFR51_3209 [Sphingosinicella microcystinivorans]RKS90911.1 hypothetical protein DFR51_0455 [Sphingosinicella microcystinivorans]BBE33828.1 hypothetical protein SmB9_14860 [Sphingosinicella microcystinivorans]BBE35395.1 hypothetical protein SmB9_30530 [Sphingosinicella microcystinivorans]